MKNQHPLNSCRWTIAALLLALLAFSWKEPLNGQAVLDLPQIKGTNVTLGWSSTIPVGALQVAPTVDGPWTTISDASTFVSKSVVTPLGSPARFFRVKNNGVPGPTCPILPEGLQQSPQMTFASIQRLAQPIEEGNTRLDIRFAPGTIPNSFSNIVPLLLENRVALLRDDGQGLDKERSDGVFSVGIFVDPAELDAANAHLDAQPPSRKFTQQFVERRRVGDPNIPLSKFPTTNFNAGQIIPLLTTNRFGPVKLNCPAGNPLAYDWRKTMIITDLPVVADPTRTHEPCPWPAGSGPGLGKWTFGRLMTDMANFPVTGIKPGVFAREWLRSWEFDQVINSFLVPKVNPIKT
ncbi:MAG TPA: hypothetical protein VIY86_13065, partial [Pirellulaceae bacterium]